MNRFLKRRCAFLLCLFLLSGCMLAPTAAAKEGMQSVSGNHADEERSVSGNHADEERSVSSNHADEERSVSDNHTEEEQGISDNDLGGLSLTKALSPVRMPGVRGADVEKMFKNIADFTNIALYYAGADGKPSEKVVSDGDLLGKDTPLSVEYTYTIKADQFKGDDKIVADTPYYLDISTHLKLPSLDAAGNPLTIEIENEAGETKKKEFGRIHADGSRAWITFTSNSGSTGTVLEECLEGSDFEDANFYLGCNRAGTLPGDVMKNEDNRYEMVLEDKSWLTFGYAENEPISAPATIQKGGSQNGNSNVLTWTITYKPWENPTDKDSAGMDSLFEVRDTIDGSLHAYQMGSAKISANGADVEYALCYSRSDIPADNKDYLLIEEVEKAEGDGTVRDTVLVFGGKTFAAAASTQGSPAKPLTITYSTVVKKELLLPGAVGGNKVKNAAELFVRNPADGDFAELDDIHAEKEVTVKQPEWLTKKGTTTRDPGKGSETAWEVKFSTNGFSLSELTGLTLHDVLPDSSKLVGNQVEVKVGEQSGEWLNVTSTESGFIVPLSSLSGTGDVVITYTTQVEEETYDQGEDLGKNTVQAVFTYDGTAYTTEASAPVGSGSGSGGSSSTARLVKSAGTYHPATRTIDWTVTINPHKANLISGTFTDDLSGVGVQPGVCQKKDHTQGLELVKKNSYDQYEAVTEGESLHDDNCVRVSVVSNNGTSMPETDIDKYVQLSYDGANRILEIRVEENASEAIGYRTITLNYITRVCDPCVFANNTTGVAFANAITTKDMQIGSQPVSEKTATATAPVKATVLTKKPPVYNYADGTMKWTIEVDAAGLPMTDVVLVDVLPAGLTYVSASLTTSPGIPGANATAKQVTEDGQQKLTISLGSVSNVTTVIFETKVEPETLGFGGSEPVKGKNSIRMEGNADGIPFEVSHEVTYSFTNHGLVKNSTQVNETEEWIQYEVLINPYHLKLPARPKIVDTLGPCLQLDRDSICLYRGSVTGDTDSGSGRKPGYVKDEPSKRTLMISGYDPEKNSFTVELPIAADSTDAYILTYRADIISRQTGGYGNSVRFEGGGISLGGDKNNNASVGGGGGGGGGVAKRKAMIRITLTGKDGAPLVGVPFTLYLWEDGKRGMAFAQAVSDADGNLTFRVPPGKAFELVQTGKDEGHYQEIKWDDLPTGVQGSASGIRFTAGAASSELSLALKNDPLPNGGSGSGEGGSGSGDGGSGSGDGGSGSGDGGSGSGDGGSGSGDGGSGSGSGSGDGSGSGSGDGSGSGSGSGSGDGSGSGSSSGGGHGSGSGSGSGGGHGSGSGSGPDDAFGGDGDTGDDSGNSGMVHFENLLPGGLADMRAQTGSFSAVGIPAAYSAKQESGFTNVPRTKDNTPKLFAVFAVSGILTGSVSLYGLAKRKGQKWMPGLFYGILLLAFSCSGILFAFRLVKLNQGNHFYDQIKVESSGSKTRIEMDERNDIAPAEADAEKEGEAAPGQQALVQRLSDFSEEYPEAAAWVQIPGTSVDYPVMLGNDNGYYLNHLPDGEKNVMGSLFLDCRTGMDSPHLIVYGHNMADGNMFGQLKRYESQDYFAGHETLTVATADAAYVCPIFSVRRVDADAHVYRTKFQDQDALTDYAAESAAESLYPIDADLNNIRGVVTLSTCTSNSRQRLVVQAALPEE